MKGLHKVLPDQSGLLNFNVFQVYYIQRGDNKLNRKARNANGYLLSSG